MFLPIVVLVCAALVVCLSLFVSLQRGVAYADLSRLFPFWFKFALYLALRACLNSQFIPPVFHQLVVGYAYLFLAPAAPYRSSGQMAADVKPWLAAATDTLAAAAVDPLAAIRRGAPRLPNVPHKQVRLLCLTVRNQ